MCLLHCVVTIFKCLDSGILEKRDRPPVQIQGLPAIKLPGPRLPNGTIGTININIAGMLVFTAASTKKSISHLIHSTRFALQSILCFHSIPFNLLTSKTRTEESLSILALTKPY